MNKKPGQDSKIQFNRPLLPFLVGLLFLLQLIVPYQGWLVLLVGLGGGWLISWLWAQSLARGLRLQREMRIDWAQVGDRIVEQFTLSNRGWLRGLGIEMIDGSNLPRYQASSLTSVDSGSDRRWHIEGVCVRRGLFTLGPTSLVTADPLGLYTVTQTYSHTTTLMVTPRVVHLPTIEVAPGGHAGDGRRRANILEPTVSAVGVRGYAPGDAANTIHWPTSVRRNTLFVRTFDNTPVGDWWIVLDLDRRVQAGQDHHSTEEHGIILAASLADRGLKAGRAVGMIGHGAELAWLPPQTGDHQRWQILRTLALIELGETRLETLLTQARSSIGQFSSLVLITPAMDGTWLTTLLAFLRRGVVPTVLLLDPATFDPDRSDTAAEAIAIQLARLGIVHHTISKTLLDATTIS